MNLVAVAPLWLILIFCLAMIAAAVEDAMRFRISNLTSLVVIAGAVVCAIITGPSWALWQNGAVFVAILLLGTVAFKGGWLGGGDVKLFAAAGLWFDLRSAVTYVALVFLSGGLVAIAYLLSRPIRREPAGGWKRSRIPYGIAIALGALAIVLMDSSLFRHHERTLPPIRIIVPHKA